MPDYRPRRSMLFMPASNARAIEKARTLSADGIIFDLEDAVAPDAKAEARKAAAEAVASRAYGARELVIRINGLDTDWWRDDLKAAAMARPDAILVPKVEQAEDIKRVEEALIAMGVADLPIWAMLETPRAFLHAEAIAVSSPWLKAFVIGANDLVKDLQARHVPGRQPILTALGIAMLVGRAHGLLVLDSVYGNFKDTDGFARECAQACEMGFDGKTLIHPSQVEAANAAFAPHDADIEQAARMITAFEDAKALGKGVATLDGRMVEELHVRDARRILAMAEAIARLAAMS